mmetsp:Transcript_101175/g.178117  ORF Transcript_101175/g.178117 Transcript_101175/m.178117 type:complete len:185 (+) Transcript_101175:80-634(+)
MGACCTSMTKKVHKTKPVVGWRHSLGEFMESPHVSVVIILLILTDLTCTVLNDMCDNGLVDGRPIFNPEIEALQKDGIVSETTHLICVYILCIFLAEQLLHIVAYGFAFFKHFWYVMDLTIVIVSLICETVLEEKAEDWLALLIVLRLWKVVAFIFDLLLADQEDTEKDEKEKTLLENTRLSSS